MERALKKIAVVVLSLACAVFFAACGGGGDENTPPADSGSSGDDAANAETAGDIVGDVDPVELRFAYPNTEMSVTGRGFTYFAERCAELSDGAMTVTMYPAGSLVQNADVVDALQNGTVEFSHFNITYVTPVIKEFTPLEVPGLLPSGKFYEWDAASHDLISEIFERYGIHYMAAIDSGTDTFSTREKMVKSPDDLKGLNVRAGGRWIGNVVSSWGANPVTVSLGDIPTALERGMIDSVYTGWIVAGPNKFYEQAPYVTFTTIPQPFTGFAMAQSAWEGLTPAQQEVVSKAAEDFTRYVHEMTELEAEKIKSDITEAGAEWYDLTPEENAVFAATIPQVIEEAITVAGEDGKKLVEIFEGLK
jgi:TRAP-type C4-dicarboxylate transport system substrate-binding protein